MKVIRKKHKDWIVVFITSVFVCKIKISEIIQTILRCKNYVNQYFFSIVFVQILK